VENQLKTIKFFSALLCVTTLTTYPAIAVELKPEMQSLRERFETARTPELLDFNLDQTLNCTAFELITNGTFKLKFLQDVDTNTLRNVKHDGTFIRYLTRNSSGWSGSNKEGTAHISFRVEDNGTLLYESTLLPKKEQDFTPSLNNPSHAVREYGSCTRVVTQPIQLKPEMQSLRERFEAAYAPERGDFNLDQTMSCFGFLNSFDSSFKLKFVQNTDPHTLRNTKTNGTFIRSLAYNSKQWSGSNSKGSRYIYFRVEKNGTLLYEVSRKSNEDEAIAQSLSLSSHEAVEYGACALKPVRKNRLSSFLKKVTTVESFERIQ
jgi:hypothetical protein